MRKIIFITFDDTMLCKNRLIANYDSNERKDISDLLQPTTVKKY